ncbi:hypothetical protein EC973_006209 [Apophysomyces ossiformis]|uniref:Uncharacterized protein n=1 Tax=Apophysomyces ossiformis TaxID=679940 RepID=A0A8H7BYY9_9FUNG|nr:hypothetical protein EC973_006209 [Apophysomyces ossiformis]
MLSKFALLQPVRRVHVRGLYRVASLSTPPLRETHNLQPHLDDLQGVINSIESDLSSIEGHDFSNGSTAIQVRQLAFLLESNAQKIRQLTEAAHEAADDKRKVEETFATLMQNAASRDVKATTATERLEFEEDVVADILRR